MALQKFFRLKFFDNAGRKIKVNGISKKLLNENNIIKNQTLFKMLPNFYQLLAKKYI